MTEQESELNLFTTRLYNTYVCRLRDNYVLDKLVTTTSFILHTPPQSSIITAVFSCALEITTLAKEIIPVQNER